MGVASACYFSELFLRRWSGCKSSVCLWMWLWTHPLPLVSLPRLLIPSIRQLLLVLLRRVASPSHSPALSPPPWVTVTAAHCLPTPPQPPPSSSWQLERTFNNEGNIIALIWLKPSGGFFLHLGWQPKPPPWPSGPRPPCSLTS